MPEPFDLPTCGLCGEPFHLGSRCVVPIPEGRRNDSLFRLGARLIRWGGSWFDSERVEEYLQVDNERRCSPPLPASEVRTIAHSANSTVRLSLRRGRAPIPA
jgi:Primase C terminal 1 (PriCT-1)